MARGKTVLRAGLQKKQRTGKRRMVSPKGLFNCKTVPFHGKSKKPKTMTSIAHRSVVNIFLKTCALLDARTVIQKYFRFSRALLLEVSGKVPILEVLQPTLPLPVETLHCPDIVPPNGCLL
ncbi:hypothetical protein [Chryseolinea lacunae]|uniref:Uncharacterized protein n=1 Tax=Chryseolinea lacunae TaxID=2801331 RepID=A0ABS1KJV9_9BACT|nr:hypothetical protein [Chryseolinea lacunae]MBL0739643.1 hypothetical protein [Chryseolinea lacunae]